MPPDWRQESQYKTTKWIRNNESKATDRDQRDWLSLIAFQEYVEMIQCKMDLCGY